MGIRFLVCGSAARGTHGLPGQTNDIDMFAEIPLDSLEELVETLSTSF